MANTSSAKKAIRQTKTKTLRNLRQRREIKKLKKETNLLIVAGKKAQAEKKLSLVAKKLDKAAKTHLIHKNTASRYKSQLAKKVNSINTTRANHK